MANSLERNLARLPYGRSPYEAYRARSNYLNRVFDKAGIMKEEDRAKITEDYIGRQPSPASHGDTTGDWWNRTGYKLAYSTGATFEGLRALYNDMTDDPEDRDQAISNMRRMNELYSSVPDDDSFWQDLIVSSPTMVASMAVAMPTAIVAGKLGAGFATKTALGALSSLATNVALNTSGSFTEALDNPETEKYLKQIFGEDVDLKEKKLEIARESAKTRAIAESVNPANILTALIDVNPALSTLSRLGFFGRAAKNVLFRTPNTKVGKMFPNIRDVAVKAGIGATMEGVQEASQDATEQAISLYQNEKLRQRAELGLPEEDTNVDLSDVIKDIDYGRVAYSGLLGGTLGGMVTGVSSGVQRAIDLPRERIRQEVRFAIETGEPEALRAVFNKFEPGSAERVIAESEYEDIQKGVVTDYRVDKDKTRYYLRSGLAQAFESGEQDLQRWILEHRDNRLSASVVNDFFRDLDERRKAQTPPTPPQAPTFYPPVVSQRDFRLGEQGGFEGELDPVAERQRRREEAEFRQRADETIEESAREQARQKPVDAGDVATRYEGMMDPVPVPDGGPIVPFEQTQTRSQKAEPQPEPRQETEEEIAQAVERTKKEYDEIFERLRKRRKKQDDVQQEETTQTKEEQADEEATDQTGQLLIPLSQRKKQPSAKPKKTKAKARKQPSAKRKEADVSTEGPQPKTAEGDRKFKTEAQKKPKKKPATKPIPKETEPVQEFTPAEDVKPTTPKAKKPATKKKKTPPKKEAPVRPPAEKGEGTVDDRADRVRQNANITDFREDRDSKGKLKEVSIYDKDGSVDKFTREELEEADLITTIDGRETFDLTRKKPKTKKEKDDREETARDEEPVREEKKPEDEKPPVAEDKPKPKAKRKRTTQPSEKPKPAPKQASPKPAEKPLVKEPKAKVPKKKSETKVKGIPTVADNAIPIEYKTRLEEAKARVKKPEDKPAEVVQEPVQETKPVVPPPKSEQAPKPKAPVKKSIQERRAEHKKSFDDQMKGLKKSDVESFIGFGIADNQFDVLVKKVEESAEAQKYEVKDFDSDQYFPLDISEEFSIAYEDTFGDVEQVSVGQEEARGQVEGEMETVRTTATVEPETLDTAQTDNRPLVYRTDKVNTNTGERTVGSDFIGVAKVSAPVKRSLMRLNEIGLVRTAEDVKNLAMLEGAEGTSAKVKKYRLYNKRTGNSGIADQDQIINETTAKTIINFAKDELGVDIPVIGMESKPLQFTYGDPAYFGEVFRKTFGGNVQQYIRDIDDEQTGIKDITAHAKYSEDGVLKMPYIKTKDLSFQGRQDLIENAPEFIDFNDFINDIKKFGVKDVRIEVDKGKQVGAQAVNVKGETVGLDPYIGRAEKTGEQILVITLGGQQVVTGKNNNQPVDVVYRIGLKSMAGAPSTKALMQFARDLIQPSFRPDELSDIKVDEYSRAPKEDIGAGLSTREVLSELARFSQQFKGANLLNYKIFEDVESAQTAGYDIRGDARGAYVLEDNEVILIANNIKDQRTARLVLFHESIGHAGVRMTLGDRAFNSLLDEMISKRKLDVRKKAKELGVDDRVAAEEIIAEIAEGRANQTTLQRFIELIRDWFERYLGSPMSDAEIRSVVIKAEKKFRDEGESFVLANPNIEKILNKEKSPNAPISSNEMRYSIGSEMAKTTPEQEGKLEDAQNGLFEYLRQNSQQFNELAGMFELSEDYQGGSAREFNQEFVQSMGRPFWEELVKASEWSIANRNKFNGWYMAPDGGWRYEIPDVDGDGNPVLEFTEEFLPKPDNVQVNVRIGKYLKDMRMSDPDFFVTQYKTGAKIKQFGTDKLYDQIAEYDGAPILKIVRHKGLEEAYPDLMKAMKIKFDWNMNPMSAGRYDIETGDLIINPKGETMGEFRQTILHELTHAIQHLNGFAQGGSTVASGLGLYNAFDFSYQDVMDQINYKHFSGLEAIEISDGFSLGDLLFEHAESYFSNQSQTSAIKLISEQIRDRKPAFMASMSGPDHIGLWKSLADSFSGKKEGEPNIYKNVFTKQTYDLGDVDADEMLSKFGNEFLSKSLAVKKNAVGSMLDRFGKPFIPYGDNGIYFRLLGEMEARDVEYRSFADGRWMLKETAPFQFLKDIEGITLENSITRFPTDKLYMSEYNADPEKLANDEQVKTIRYSVAPNPSTPITSRRSPNATAPSWMSDDQARVFNIPQFGNPIAGKTFGEKLEIMFRDIGMKIRQGVFDRFASFKKLGTKAYIKARMSNSSEGPLDALFRLGAIYMDEDGAINVDTDSKSLVEVLSPLGSDLDTFLKWVAAKRHQELKNDPDFPREALQFLDDAELDIALSFNEGDTIDAITGRSISREDLFNNVYEDFKTLQNAVTEIARKSGLINDETAKVWEKQFYVPFYRVLEEEAGEATGPITLDSLVNQKAYRKLKGSDAHLGDLLQNTLLNWNHLISASLKNNAGKQAIAEMLKTDGGGLPSAISLGDFPINDGKVEKFVLNRWDKATPPPGYIHPDDAQVVHVMKNGKRHYYKILDPMYLESLMALNKVGTDNPFFSFLRGSKRWYTYSVTFSPEFKVRNLIRDTITSLAVSPTSLNAFDNAFGKGWAGTAKDSKTYAQLLAGGGSFAFGSMSGVDSDQTRRMIESNIKKEYILDNPMGMANFQTAMGGAFNIAKKWWGKWDDLGGRLENVNRAALYQKLRSEGKSHLEASYQARDLLDFSNHGSFGAILYLANFSPFLNARLQGLYKIGKAAIDPQQMTRFYSVLGGYVAASTALYLAYKDDEDFQDREEWDRDTYHWFKIPGFSEKGDIAFRIPKAFEMGVIATMVERTLEQFVDDEVHGKLFADRLWHALTDTFAFDVRPMPLRPIMDIYSNKNPFTDRPIESMSMQNMSPENRRNAYTSEFTSLVSRGTHDLIPWDKVTLSPVQLEYVVNGFGGYIGGIVLEGADAMVRVIQGKEKPTRHWSKYPVIKALVDDPNERVYTKYGTQFYNMSREMTRTFRDIKELRELGDIERARSIADKKRLMLRYRKSTNKLQRRASEINNEISRITADPNMDGDLKKMRINRLNQIRNSILKSGVLRTPQEIRGEAIMVR